MVGELVERKARGRVRGSGAAGAEAGVAEAAALPRGRHAWRRRRGRAGRRWRWRGLCDRPRRGGLGWRDPRRRRRRRLPMEPLLAEGLVQLGGAGVERRAAAVHPVADAEGNLGGLCVVREGELALGRRLQRVAVQRRLTREEVVTRLEHVTRETGGGEGRAAGGRRRVAQRKLGRHAVGAARARARAALADPAVQQVAGGLTPRLARAVAAGRGVEGGGGGHGHVVVVPLLILERILRVRIFARPLSLAAVAAVARKGTLRVLRTCGPRERTVPCSARPWAPAVRAGLRQILRAPGPPSSQWPSSTNAQLAWSSRQRVMTPSSQSSFSAKRTPQSSQSLPKAQSVVLEPRTGRRIASRDGIACDAALRA